MLCKVLYRRDKPLLLPLQHTQPYVQLARTIYYMPKAAHAQILGCVDVADVMQDADFVCKSCILDYDVFAALSKHLALSLKLVAPRISQLCRESMPCHLLQPHAYQGLPQSQSQGGNWKVVRASCKWQARERILIHVPQYAGAGCDEGIEPGFPSLPVEVAPYSALSALSA